MTLGGWWPQVSSGTAGADIRQSRSARSCISPQSSFHSRWCLSCICGNHLGKSCGVFFVVFFFKPATFYRISHPVVYCKSRNETSERMWDLYIPTSIQKKKKVKADFRSSEVRWSEGLWLISWKHCSACLIEALFPISLCTWGIDRAFPTVHCEAQLQADETLRVYTCLLHPVWPPLLSLPLIFPLSLGQYEFAMRPKPTGWTCLLLNVSHKHTNAFTCPHQPFYQVCASLASVLCYISSTSPQVAVILVNSPLYR